MGGRIKDETKADQVISDFISNPNQTYVELAKKYSIATTTVHYYLKDCFKKTK